MTVDVNQKKFLTFCSVILSDFCFTIIQHLSLDVIFFIRIHHPGQAQGTGMSFPHCPETADVHWRTGPSGGEAMVAR